MWAVICRHGNWADCDFGSAAKPITGSKWALERTAWSAFWTEFYATYDFAQIAKKSREQALSGGDR